jgi:hypothetical protein
MHRFFSTTVLLLFLLLCIPATPANEGANEGALAVYFQEDPLAAPSTVLVGAAADRVEWNFDPPAYPGDRPGSVTAVYDSNEPPALLGFPLAEALDQDDPFTAAAMFVIDPDDFAADPNGFFQISWGLWNSTTTGLERTGNFVDFAGDTFDLIEFDYFPNVTFFGGPFVSPTLLGEANPADPSFSFLGSFANLTFASASAELPLGEPLLALMEHRPDVDSLVVTVYRILNGNHLVPVTGATTTIPLGFLSSRAYQVDVVGLTLWKDGFVFDAPSLFARVTYHGLIVTPGLLDRPEQILHIPPRLPE